MQGLVLSAENFQNRSIVDKIPSAQKGKEV